MLLFIRWLIGYIDFRIQGAFPERFMNAAVKRGLRTWNLRGGKESLWGCVRWSDRSRAEALARSFGQTFTVCGEHGFPAGCLRYRSRMGLLAGLLSGTILAVLLGGRIWNIHFNLPPQINEYEVRQELETMGYAPGCVYEAEAFARMEEEMCRRNPRMSWMCINVFGTNSFVTATEVLRPRVVEDPSMQAGNLLSGADGTVTGTQVASGEVLVKPGEGIRKGQILVSGVQVLDNGESKLVRSTGKIFAKTARKIVFSLPKTLQISCKGEAAGEQWQAEGFGLFLPLRLQGEPEGDLVCCDEREQFTLLGNDLPILLHRRRFWRREQKTFTLSERTAREMLQKRRDWYEAGAASVAYPSKIFLKTTP